MHGNRDFLLGQAFCKAAGCTLLKDPSVVQL
jgi:UDP-2,3-diacylglucosamine hydrolase